MKAFVYFVFVSCSILSASCNYISQRAAKENQILDSFNIVNNRLKQGYDSLQLHVNNIKIIGTQVWTATNLNVTTFRNGVRIPEAETNGEWRKASNKGTPAWCYYEGDPANGKKFGRLYNWYAVYDSNGLAPAGWHIPTDEEWDTLVEHGSGKGFSALPGGFRITWGSFYGLGDAGYFWSSSIESDNNDAWYRYQESENSELERNYIDMGCGFSVRCVKD
jgi:hypothetical protein